MCCSQTVVQPAVIVCDDLRVMAAEEVHLDDACMHSYVCLSRVL